MKKLLIAAIVLPVMAYKCGKTEKSDKEGWLQGKVVRTSCASFVVQVLNNDTVGEDGWKDMMNKNVVYNHVFTANNQCKISATIKSGSNIQFKIAPPVQNDCVTCMMFDGPPQTKYDITDVTVIDGK